MMAFLTTTKSADENQLFTMHMTQFNELTEYEVSQIYAPFDEVEKNNSRDEPITTSVDQFIAAQAKKNTQQATQRDMKNVQRWLYNTKREPRLIEHILPSHLNDLLAELFIGIRKTDGENYEPSSLESLKNSIERYLKEKNYESSLRERVFSKCIRALTAKKMELKKLGHGNRPNKCLNVTEQEEEKMYVSSALGTNNPKSLQFTVFYNFGKMFGLRGRDEARQLKFGDVTAKTTSGGNKFLEFTERATKTRDGADLSNTRATTPKIFASGGARDPVEVYETFVRRRPVTMMSADSPFYLTAIPERCLSGTADEPWYYPRPMGVAMLGGLMKNAAQQAGIHSRLTNHSIRKATVTTLSKAGVPPHKIMKITGHKNIQSIEQYDAELSENEHQQISTILQPGKNIATNLINKPAATAANPLHEQNNVIENYANPETSIVNDNGSSSAKITSIIPNSTDRLPFPMFPATTLTGNTFHNCTFNFGNFDLGNSHDSV